MNMMIGTSNSTEKATRVKTSYGNTVTIRVSSSKNKKKKRLQYSFKSISNQIMMAKTPDTAKMVATKARGKVAMLQRNIDNDDYDETELRHAIEHAKKMLRIAKKKMHHLEEEHDAEIHKTAQIENDSNGVPELPDEEDREQEKQEFELDNLMDEYQDLMSELMSEFTQQTMERMMEETQLQELADEFMGDVQQEDLAPEDLERLKKKHRSDELRQIMEADLKYLKAMINKLEKERQDLSAGNFSTPAVTLEISGIEMPVQAATAAAVTPEGEVVDVSL